MAIMSLNSSAPGLSAMPPPPGQPPNFENREFRGLVLIILCSVCLALMWPGFLLRIYTKVWVTRSFWWDDGRSLFRRAGISIDD